MKRFSIITCAAVFAVCFFPGSANAGQWTKVYSGLGNEQDFSISPAAKDGYYMSGVVPDSSGGDKTYFGKLDSSANVTWVKKLSVFYNDNLNVTPVSDGYRVTGLSQSEPSSPYPIKSMVWGKFDLNWKPIYQWMYGGFYYLDGAFNDTSDGGMLWSGTCYSSGQDVLLVKIGPAGTVAWKKGFSINYPYSTATYTISSLSLCVEVKDGYVILGTVSQKDSNVALLWIKVSKKDGTVISERLIQPSDGSPFSYNNYPTRVLLLSDGNILVAGSKVPPYGWITPVLIKLGADGRIMWQYAFNMSGKPNYASSGAWVDAIRENPDHTLLLSGNMSLYGGILSSMFIMELSANGKTIVWQKKYGTDSEYYAGSLRFDSGDALISGNYSKDGYTALQVFFCRLDATTFEPMWTETFGTTSNNTYAGGLYYVYGNFFVSGTTRAFGPGTPSVTNVFGMILGSDGDAFCHITHRNLATGNPGLTASHFNMGLTGLTYDLKPLSNPTKAKISVNKASIKASDICNSGSSAGEVSPDELEAERE